MGRKTIDSLEKVKVEFDKWRKNKKWRAEKIPKLLWDKAIALLEEHDESVVVRTLKIEKGKFNQIKKSCNSKSVPKIKKNNNKNQFVPLTPMSFLSNKTTEKNRTNNHVLIMSLASNNELDQVLKVFMEL